MACSSNLNCCFTSRLSSDSDDSDNVSSNGEHQVNIAASSKRVSFKESVPESCTIRFKHSDVIFQYIVAAWQPFHEALFAG